MGEGKTELDLEWERRTLCSDGNCIGVIGPDGNCKECGKPYDGELPDVGALNDSDSNSKQPEDMADEIDAEDVVSEDAQDLDEAWANRRLCSDGSCIGVIGSDGKCKECGKPFEG